MSIPYYDIAEVVDALVDSMSLVVSDKATEDGTGMALMSDILAIFPTVAAKNKIAVVATGTATINRAHTLGGTSYSYFLPAVGTAGNRIMLQALDTLSGVVIIDADGVELIDGALSYAMAAGDALLLEDTGTAWRIVWRKGLIGVEATSNSGQVVTLNSTAKEYEDVVTGTNLHGCWSTSTFDVFTAKRRGYFDFDAIFSPSNSSTLSIYYYDGSVVRDYGPVRSAFANTAAAASATFFMNVGDTMVIRAGVTGTAAVTPERNHFSVTEQL